MGGKTEHKCVVYKDSMYFVGGYDGRDYCNVIYKYHPESGSSELIGARGEAFSPRSALTCVVWKDKMYTFGGWNGFAKEWFNDVHEFDFETREWREVKAKGILPLQRTSHAAVVWKNSMFIFAGFSGEKYLNDMHEFNLETETWQDVSNLSRGKIPEARSRFCAAVHGDKMYVLGGWNKIGYFSDLYAFNFVTKVWIEVTRDNFIHPIPTISQYSLSVQDGYLLIFGGFCGKEQICVNKLWIYKLPDTVCHKEHRLSLDIDYESEYEPPTKRFK